VVVRREADDGAEKVAVVTLPSTVTMIADDELAPQLPDMVQPYNLGTDLPRMAVLLTAPLPNVILQSLVPVGASSAVAGAVPLQSSKTQSSSIFLELPSPDLKSTAPVE
jgi:hypothetical protein